MSRGAHALALAALALAVVGARGAFAQTSPGPQGRVVTDTLRSRALRHNAAGDSPDREVLVYLPPSYDREPQRRYPVLYLLHGVTSSPSEWLDGTYQGFDLAHAMDSLAATGMREMIVAMPDERNAIGGSFYVDSPSLGKWDEFTSRDLVRFIDGRYRTIASREARGLAGHSMGGFGALHLAARHPDVWGSVYAMSACCLGFVGELASDGRAWRAASAWMRQPIDSSLRLRVPSYVSALAAAMSRRAERPPYLARLPYVVDSLGTVRADAKVIDEWKEQLPLARLDKDRKAYAKIDAIGLEFGTEDQIANVPLGMRELSRGLSRLGIPFTLEEYAGGHIDRVRERFEGKVLPFFGRTLGGRTRVDPRSSAHPGALRAGVRLTR